LLFMVSSWLGALRLPVAWAKMLSALAESRGSRRRCSILAFAKERSGAFGLPALEPPGSAPNPQLASIPT